MGLISLGDSSYDNFCGAGRAFDALLQEQGATRVGDVLEIDAMEQPEPEVVSCPWVEQWGSLLK
ncbi:flavodoxin [Serratia plymuthica]|uniref:Flavodoxin n=1 Tax=Serratia plymuthica TaxID=82996 RepID=A0A2X4UYE2_SERPL|nr:flavodoxin [Serratia plymuthica]